MYLNLSPRRCVPHRLRAIMNPEVVAKQPVRGGIIYKTFKLKILVMRIDVIVTYMAHDHNI